MLQDAPHITVTGDAWQYVPFGRARIKALRATGLNYASQTFSINGATIKIRIVGSQSFISAAGGAPLYMETGQLEWAYPAPLSTWKYDPAKWHFLDVPTTDKYLGAISASGVQSNIPALVEAQDSLAIGYPKAKGGTPAENDAKDVITKDKYKDSTLLKKTIAGLFPASMFSGRMRLFMQALYGSKETIDLNNPFPLQISIVGTQVILNYVRGTKSVQFGFWGGATPGIFTAPDGGFWLLNITQATGLFTVTAYSIKGPEALTGRYRNTSVPLSDTEKTKLAAYIFANGHIDIADPVIVGTYPSVAGAPMAWGWKFNGDGSRASIVLHESVGSGTSQKWTSRTVDLVTSYADGVFSLAGTTTLNGNWVDGWGSFNIFVPMTETGTAPLMLFSLLAFTTASEFTFPATTVYGYYKDDVWTPVKVSCTLRTGTFPQYEWSSSGIIYDPASYPLTYSNSAPSNGSMMADGTCSYESHAISSGKAMGVSVGSSSYSGKFDFGSHFYYTKSCAQESEYTNHNGFTSYAVGLAPYVPGPPPGNGGTTSADMLTGATVTCMSYSFVGADIKGWALVIPFGDCEAAYVSTHERYTSSAFSRTTTIDGGVFHFHGLGYNYAPYTGAGTSNNGWIGLQGPSYSAVTDSASPAATETYVYCFNIAIAGVQGTPGGSYETLFIVDYTNPYYARGMYTYTSYGKRYIMSEGLQSPASVTTAPFVGWA